jgi:hypothetical protein
MPSRKLVIESLSIVFLLMLCAVATQAQSQFAGTYRCVSFNVGGQGGRCTSPPLILMANGRYQMSGERGTFAVRGDRLSLSESRLRGPGRLYNNEIVFEYVYRGLMQTVTYRRQEGATEFASSNREPGGGSRSISVSINVSFSSRDGSVGWINSANLIPEGGEKRDGYETLARTDGKFLVRVRFDGVMTGRRYTLLLGSGFDTRTIGFIDLRQARGSMNINMQAAAPTNRNRFQSPTVGPGYLPPGSRH